VNPVVARFDGSSQTPAQVRAAAQFVEPQQPQPRRASERSLASGSSDKDARPTVSKGIGPPAEVRRSAGSKQTLACYPFVSADLGVVASKWSRLLRCARSRIVPDQLRASAVRDGQHHRIRWR
jgi:hypothetical protein